MSVLSILLIFVVYSVLGFIVETIYTSIPAGKLMHRGFLFGPYIPIYGFGAAFITFFLQRFQGNPIVIFILSFVICSILEYITSWALEVLFHARWWDYSSQFMNIHGRICLKNSCLFGIGGIVIVDLINARLINLSTFGNIDEIMLIGFFLFGVISMDFFVSMVVLWDIKQTIDLSFGDNTAVIKEQKIEYVRDYFEDLSEEFKNDLSRRSLMHKRTLQAFDLRVRVKRK